MHMPDKIITPIVSEIPLGLLGKPFEIDYTFRYNEDAKLGFLKGSNIAIYGAQDKF